MNCLKLVYFIPNFIIIIVQIAIYTNSLKNSIAAMESLVNAEKGKWQELDDTLTQLKQECDQLNTQLTEFSAGVPDLQDEYNKLERLVSCHA